MTDGLECEAWQGSLRGAVLVSACEDDNNAYTTCCHCGHKNVLYGFDGED